MQRSCPVPAVSLFAFVLVLSATVCLHAAPDAKQAEQDVEKLQTWAKFYGDSQLLQEDPKKLAELVAQAPQVEEEVKQIKARWGLDADARRERDAQKVANMHAFFERNWNSYTNRIEAFKRDGPREIAKYLDEAEQMSAQAVAEQKPLLFTGGVPQRMNWAADRLAVLGSIDPEAAKPLAARHETLKAAIPQQEVKLRDAIIAANEPPRDNYSGPDKSQLTEKVSAAWKAKHPEDAIVATRFPAQDWKRDTRWQWSGASRAFEKVDRSRLQGQILVPSADDPKLLEVHVVDLYKDHLSGDAITAVCRDKSDVPVQNLVLKEKVK